MPHHLTGVLAPTTDAASATRLVPLDALRGIIMLVMALDHANVFIAHAHPPPEMWTGFFPRYDSALPFFTRFVTHFAAPGFFFLMGTAMILFAESHRKAGWKESEIVRHLMVRGVLLIALQFLVENRAWQLGEQAASFPLYFGVLYGLGAAMMVSALMLRLPSVVLIGTSIATIVATHLWVLNATDRNVPVVIRALMLPGSTGNVLVYYPLIPWLGVVLFGMVLGRWLLKDRAQAYRRSLWLGLVFLVVFFIVRMWGGFGNIRSVEGTDWISFLNVVKYPPSLVFLLLMLGVDLILLFMFHKLEWNRLLVPLAVFGKSPLFFYLMHLYLYAVIGIALGPRGTGILGMYPYWILGLIILYLLCWSYGQIKQRQPANSLLRFF